MSRLYFTALRTLERLEIQYVPRQLVTDRSAKTADVEIVGRNNPQYHYTGGNTQMNLKLDFHSEESSREDVIKKVKWLESLTYSDGYENPPEQVRLTFGKLFSNNEIWVVQHVRHDLSLFDDNNGFLPRQAYVDIILKLDTKRNSKTEDVKWS